MRGEKRKKMKERDGGSGGPFTRKRKKEKPAAVWRGLTKCTPLFTFALLKLAQQLTPLI